MRWTGRSCTPWWWWNDLLVLLGRRLMEQIRHWQWLVHLMLCKVIYTEQSWGTWHAAAGMEQGACRACMRMWRSRCCHLLLMIELMRHSLCRTNLEEVIGAYFDWYGFRGNVVHGHSLASYIRVFTTVWMNLFLVNVWYWELGVKREVICSLHCEFIACGRNAVHLWLKLEFLDNVYAWLGFQHNYRAFLSIGFDLRFLRIDLWLSNWLNLFSQLCLYLWLFCFLPKIQVLNCSVHVFGFS